MIKGKPKKKVDWGIGDMLTTKKKTNYSKKKKKEKIDIIKNMVVTWLYTKMTLLVY